MVALICSVEIWFLFVFPFSPIGLRAKQLWMRLLVVGAIGLLGGFGLPFLAKYHTVSVQQTTNQFEGAFAVKAPSFPVTLQIDFFSPGQVLTIDKFSWQTSRGMTPPVPIWETNYQKQYWLKDFKASNQWSAKYVVSGGLADSLYLRVPYVDPNTTSVLYPEDLWTVTLWSGVFGLSIALAGAMFLTFKYWKAYQVSKWAA